MSARRGVAWLALASFLSPSTLPLLAAAWLLAHHADAHAHALLIEADAGHFDLVLAHEDAAEHEHEDHSAHGHGRAEPRHEGDHVVHFAGEGDTCSRRLAPDGAPLLTAHVLPRTSPPAVRLRACGAPPASGGDTLLLRTIVLRL